MRSCGMTTIENQHFVTRFTSAEDGFECVNIQGGRKQVVDVGIIAQQVQLLVKDSMAGKMDEQQIGWLTLLSKGLEACQGMLAALGYNNLCAGELAIESLEGISQADG